MTDFIPTHYEEITSQIPALHLLINLGYTYLLPKEAHQLRGSKNSNVILTDILHQYLSKQHFTRLGKNYKFSEKSIKEAIKALQNIEDIGLIQTNQDVWKLLRLGKSFEETYDGGKASFDLNYIDWQHPENNLYHVTDEYEIERKTSNKNNRPDIVLFVNGIPFVTIECKRSGIDDPIGQAINQLKEYQKNDYIPHLFHYNQLLLAIAPNPTFSKIEDQPKYGTVGTAKQFWAVWKEENKEGNRLETLINQPLSPTQTDKLFTKDKNRFTHFSVEDARQHYQNNLDHGRTVTAQDQLIYALCSPERLLELSDRYSLFDSGERKIARYQQYFTVKNILDRIKTEDKKGKRKGGVVWHTQGSGKSLTMVLLAEAIAKEPHNPESTIKDPRIILVTDRTDLDDQIYGTFANCGTAITQATTGKHLRELLDEPKASIITTIINKFDTIADSQNYKNESSNIFILVDEAHRSQFGKKDKDNRGQFGTFHRAMKQVLPNACFIGFTGTPIENKERSSVELFGGMIQPTYTIRRALEDGAVVPLLYESRLVDQEIDAESLDRWFERYTTELSEEQKAKLKKRFATKTQLNQVDSKIEAIAWDITGHYCTNFQKRGLKAQLVTQNKASAIKYKKYLDEFGKVSSEVLISPPDIPEGDENLTEDKESLKKFWDGMMEHHLTPEKYQENLVKAFKYQDHPEIIIVVDKLLTGFDAPQNTVLYLTRPLKDHLLLQAIARVNRLYEGKEYGVIIDYAGILQQLGDAIYLYDSLEGDYDKDDLDGIIITLSQEWRSIEQKYSNLWDIFSGITNRQNNNAFVELLQNEKIRLDFNECLSVYGRTLQLALSSVSFFDETPREKIQRYKQDFKFFVEIRQMAARQYGDTLDLKQHQKTIQNLLNTHVKAKDVQTLIELTDIFDQETFEKEIETLPNPVSKAEVIANRTIRTITEKLQEDEIFYQPFSDRLKEILDQIRAQRYQDAEALLKEAKDICDRVRNRNKRDDIPELLRHREVAQAYYGIVYSKLQILDNDPDLSAKIAIGIDDIIQKNRIINWQKNNDVQNQMKNQIEDFLFDELNENSLSLDFEAIDHILDKCVATAVIRLPDA